MRKLVLLCACLAVVVACGPEPVEITPDRPFAELGDVSVTEAAPAAAAYSLSLDEPVGDEQLDALLSVEGVGSATPVAVSEVPIDGPSGTERLRVAAIDPLGYRALAPPETRDAEFVWTALLGSEAVVSFDAADRLGIDDAGRIEIDGTPPVGVGAVADNGAPNLAGVMVDDGVASTLGLPGPEDILVGATESSDLEELGGRLAEALPGADVDRLYEGEVGSVAAPRPGTVEHGGLAGAMRFKVLSDGFIRPDRSWVERNIVTTEVSILGTVTCHRVMIPQLQAALAEIEAEGLGAYVDPGDYGGCYVPRFVDRDPGNPLSMHAFGLAIDINVSSNPLGTEGNQEPRVVEIFRSWGFQWGGDFSRPDPMHFELERVMRA